MKSNEKLYVVNEIGTYGSLEVKDPTAKAVPVKESTLEAKQKELLAKGYTIDQIAEMIKDGTI